MQIFPKLELVFGSADPFSEWNVTQSASDKKTLTCCQDRYGPVPLDHQTWIMAQMWLLFNNSCVSIYFSHSEASQNWFRMFRFVVISGLHIFSISEYRAFSLAMSPSGNWFAHAQAVQPELLVKASLKELNYDILEDTRMVLVCMFLDFSCTDNQSIH